MNMKPGELGRVIHTINTGNAKLSGIIIKVTTSYLLDGEPHWFYEAPEVICGCGCGFPIETFGDKVLRPLGNPGEDEVDEMLIRVGKPKEIENV